DAVAHVIATFDDQTKEMYAILTRALSVRSEYYKERRACWPVAELVDTMEIATFDIGILSSKFRGGLAQSAGGVARDHDLVNDFVMVATESSRLLAVNGVLNAVALLGDNVRGSIVAELERRLDAARQDPHAYRIFHDLLTPVNSPMLRHCTEHDLVGPYWTAARTLPTVHV
ncbi:hypothetical protein BVRB_037230, partial [Beta vulgaris subsp. vulgaris]